MTRIERRGAIFITGGSSGIGAQLVRDSAAAGYDVGFTYFAETEAAAAVASESMALNPDATIKSWHLDVRRSEAVETVVDEAIDVFETIDAVVCNAGITRVGLMFSMSDKDWQDVIDTNLTGSFYVCRQFLSHFLANRFGRFIHISSIAMHGMAGQAGYCASKAGLNGLSSAIAKEYGRKGVTSNTIALGLIDAGLTATDASDRTMNFWKEFCPAGRLGDITEIANAVHFLADRQSGFVNGEVLHLAGGLNQTP
ncbi:MAG: SDR family oxidoreductase [Pseudomonadota bacterium]